MLLSIQPFVIKSSPNKSDSRYFDIKADATVSPSYVTVRAHDEPHHREYHVSGLDHYVDSRLSGELFRID